MAGGRNTITQRIALDGGKAIEAELKALGAVGEEAFKRLQKAANDVKGPYLTFTGKLSDAFKAMGDAGSQLGQRMDGLRQNWTGLTEAATVVRDRLAIAGVTIAALVTGFGFMAKAAADSGGALVDLSQKAGLAVEKFQTLQFAAQQAGVSQDSFASAMARLNKGLAEGVTAGQAAARGLQPVQGAAARIAEGFNASGVNVVRFGQQLKKAGEEGGGVHETLKKLGIQVNDANGKLRATDAIVRDLADVFARMPDGPQKTAAAMAIFGKSGADLIPFLNAGSKGILEVEERLKSLGLVLTETDAKSLDGLGDEADVLGLAFTRLRDQIVAALAPQLTSATSGLIDFIAANREAIVKFTTYLGTETIGIIRDFFAVLNGGQAQRPWVQEWTKHIVAFGQSVNNVVTGIIIPKFQSLIAIFDVVAKGINAVFGTNLNGQEILILSVLNTMLGTFGLLGPSIMTVVSAVQTLFGLLTVLAAPIAVAVGLPAALVAGIIAGVAALAVAVYAYWDQIKAAADTAWTSIADSIRQKIDEAAQGAAQTWANLSAGFDTAVVALTGIWNEFTSYLSSSWTALEAGPRNFAAFLGNALTGAVNLIKSAWDEAVSFIQNSVGSVISSIRSVISSIKSAISAAADLVGMGGGSSGGGEAFASGGYVRGPGTGTSDSIRAWLSNGEYVIRAAAVRRYGKEFLAALNAGRLKVPGYATGGLVSVPSFKQGIPAFASGGLVGSLESMFAGMMPQMALPSVASVAAPTINMGRPINLSIGGETFSGLMAPEDVANRLVKFARGQAMRSAGRKPGWAG